MSAPLLPFANQKPSQSSPLRALLSGKHDWKEKPKQNPAETPVPEGIEADPMWRDGLTVSMMRESVAYFASEVLRAPGDTQVPYTVAEHHLRWERIVHEDKRACILAPRDHGKSGFFCFAYPIWRVVFFPRKRGFIFSATLDQAKRLLGDIKEELESNPKLAWLLPPKNARKKKWTESTIFLANGARIYARGYGTKIRGAHPFWIIVDDGLNDEDGYSEPIRRKNIDFFLSAITNMVTPDGQILVVGTPFHAEDLYGHLRKVKRYKCYAFPAIDHKTGKVLWPGRYSGTALREKKEEIGSVKFTREFLVSPISDDMSLFPSILFEGSPTEQFAVTLGGGRKKWSHLGIQAVFMGVDFALSAETGADYTVVFTIGIDAMKNHWVLDIERRKGLSYQSQLSLINAVGRRYRADLIYVEANQAQRIFGDELRRTTDLPIKKFVTTGIGRTLNSRKKRPTSDTITQNKNSLAGGVPALRVLLENTKVRIPRGDESSVEKTQTWIDEMRAFSWVDGKLQGVGSHDDTVMAFWIACCAARNNLDFDTGEDDEEEDLDELIRQQTDVSDDDHVELPEAEKARIRERFPEYAVDDEEDDEEEDDEVPVARPRVTPPHVPAKAKAKKPMAPEPEDEDDEDDDEDSEEDRKAASRLGIAPTSRALLPHERLLR